MHTVPAFEISKNGPGYNLRIPVKSGWKERRVIMEGRHRLTPLLFKSKFMIVCAGSACDICVCVFVCLRVCLSMSYTAYF